VLSKTFRATIAAKNFHNSYQDIAASKRGDPDMRKASAIFFGSMAALAVLTAPVAAASSGGQKSEEPSGSSPCRAYVQSADGSWTPVPCQEIGAGARTQQRSPGRNGDDASR
jgi:hypothetical protein